MSPLGVLRGEKTRFQLFGDTVNTASRMESTGTAGCIQLSESTAQRLVAAHLEHMIEPRDSLVEAKGKGKRFKVGVMIMITDTYPYGRGNADILAYQPVVYVSIFANVFTITINALISINLTCKMLKCRKISQTEIRITNSLI